MPKEVEIMLFKIKYPMIPNIMHNDLLALFHLVGEPDSTYVYNTDLFGLHYGNMCFECYVTARGSAMYSTNKSDYYMCFTDALTIFRNLLNG